MATGLLAKAFEWLLLSCHLALCPNRSFVRSLFCLVRLENPAGVGNRKGRLFELTHSEIYTLPHNDFEPDTKDGKLERQIFKELRERLERVPRSQASYRVMVSTLGPMLPQCRNDLFICFFFVFVFVLSIVFLGDGGGIEGKKDCVKDFNESRQHELVISFC